MAYKPDRNAQRLIPDLTSYPPSEYRVIMHPDVQLTAEEWFELKDYEKIENDRTIPPGSLGFQKYPLEKKVSIPLHMNRSGGIA